MKPGGDITRSMALPVCSLVIALIFLVGPFIVMFWPMWKGSRDMERAKAEFKRAVNPDDLRAWAFSQLKKHSEGGDSREAAADWPATFPRFAGSRHFWVHLSPSHDTQCANLVWGFSGGYSLKATVWLNPDGTPVDLDDAPPWAKGITFTSLAK